MSADLLALIEPLQPFAQALVDLAGRAGVNPRVTSTLRTYAQQQRLYRAYLRGENKYPVAPPGTSAHEYGFAFDMVAASREDLHDLGTVWQSWGGLWHPSDEVHFQYPGFAAPPAPEEVPVPDLIKLCDILSGFSALGEVQIADTLATWVAPLHSSPGSFERRVQAFIQGPCSTLYQAVR